MPLLDLGVYVAFETFMAFMNEPGVLEITGIPLLGNAPLVGTTTYKELVRLNPTNSASMTMQLQHINTQNPTVAERTSPTITFDAEPNLNNYGNCASLGVKVYRGDNFGILTNIYNRHTSFNAYNSNELTKSLVYAPDDGGAIEIGLQTASHFVQIFPQEGQQQQGDVVPKYEWKILNKKMINAVFTGGERYIYNIWWNTQLPGIITPPSTNCDICVIRVKGKQWPRDPRTITTSSSVQNGSAHPYCAPKSRRLTRTASQERVLIGTKMEASLHSLRTTRSARRLEKRTAAIGPPP